ARLIAEARQWGPPASLHRWWDAGLPDSGRWQHSRSYEVPERSSAIRAIVLYPTNALVEDQITRFRQAVAVSDRAGGPRFFFGRYTGATLGHKPPPTRLSAQDVRRVAQELRSMEMEYDGLPDRQEIKAQFSDPRSGEMLTRWDMICAPPDILVTN